MSGALPPHRATARSSRAPDAGATLPLGPSHVVALCWYPLGEGWERTVDHRTASHAGKLSAVLLVVAGALAACGSAATSSPATTSAEPTGWRAPAVFSTPPATGHIIEPVSANPTDLAAHGYVELEYFASGTAYSFTISGNVRIRTDLDVPVFMIETQTDLIQLGYAAAQQPNTSRIRTWEVAGTSHADAYEVGSAASLLGCTTAVNSGPQHEVAQAAFVAFLHWVDDGTQPPSPKPFTLSSADPPKLALDAHGNVVGGVRTPAVDVPVSTLSGAPPQGSSELCGLFGSTVPFSPQTLVALYRTKAGYVAAYTTDLDRAIAAGYILAADRASLLAEAAQVSFPT